MIAMMLVLAAAPASPVAQPLLQPFVPLVGHCYAGPAPGDKATDTHCFESLYGGQHVRDSHVVTINGKAVYAGETLYSAKSGEVIFSYWNSLGGLGTGTAKLATDDWHFSGTIHATPNGKEEPIAAAWTVIPDGYQVTSAGQPPRHFKRSD
jgi:hypothetical protein